MSNQYYFDLPKISICRRHNKKLNYIRRILLWIPYSGNYDEKNCYDLQE